MVKGFKSAHSGATVVLPEASFSVGTLPPPNAATGVKVCVSPPRFSTLMMVPTFSPVWSGLNFHAPTNRLCASSALNSAIVVPPLRTHAPAPRTALNDAESQSSRILKFRPRAPPPDPSFPSFPSDPSDPSLPDPDSRLARFVGDTDRPVGESAHAIANTTTAIAGTASLKLDIMLLR